VTYAAGIVAFAEENDELNVIFCDKNISEAQVLANDDYIKCSALALSPDGSSVLAGGPDGKSNLIRLAEPKTCTAITLPESTDKSVTESIECVINVGKDKFAVAVGRYVGHLSTTFFQTPPLSS
jgi:hypothetical protein